MKTKFLSAIAVMAMALGMAACSSDENLSDGGNTKGEGASTGFISINVRGMDDVQGTGAKPNFLTRADNNKGTDDGVYRDGETEESIVKNVRFYFYYDDNGTERPYVLSNSSVVGGNYIDLNFNQTSPTKPDNGDNSTVENRTNATLVLQSDYNASTKPNKIVAIVNYKNLSSDVLSAVAPSLSDVEGITNVTSANLYSNDEGFLMSNSVYPGSTTAEGNVVSSDGTTKLEADCTGKIFDSEDQASRNSVDIYVERVAAKVTVNAGATPSTTEPEYPTTASSAGWFEIDNKPAYIVNKNVVITDGTTQKHVCLAAAVDFWGLADATTNANLFKSIKDYDTWWYTLGGLTSASASYSSLSPRWFVPTFFRSFWEVTPDYTRNSYSWNQYSATTGATGSSFGNAIYTVPNTPTTKVASDEAINRRSTVTGFTTSDLTKVLVGATLYYKELNDAATGYKTDATWKVAKLVRFGGRNFLADDDDSSTSEGKLRLVLRNFYSDIYKGDDTKTPIQVDDFKLSDITETGNISDYQQSVTLVGDASTNYYRKTGDTYTIFKHGGDALTEYGRVAMVYNGGHTYYYTTIRHLWYPTDATKVGENLGAFGVVRNHLYDVKINSISGAGTPVPDPTKPIIPLTPEDKSSYMYATINVLQWRVVNQNVDLDGTTKTNTTTPAKRH